MTLTARLDARLAQEMRGRDEYGIITRNAQMRAQYGNRVAHGKARHLHALPQAATVNPFIRPKPVPERQLAVVLPPKPIPPGLTVATVLAVVARVTGASVADMRGQSQTRAISQPRQFAYWLLKNSIKISLTRCGRELGGKDHTSARTGIVKVSRMLSEGVEPFTGWRDAAVPMIASIKARIAACQQEHTAA